MGARRVLAGALLLLLGGAGASAEAVEAAGGGECAAGGEGSALAALLGVGKVRYAGPESRSALEYRYYDKDLVLRGRPMREWLRPAVAFWHTQRGDGGDPFGAATRPGGGWPWSAPRAGDDAAGLALAKRRVLAHFELLDFLGLDLWCFHDRDIAPPGETFAQSAANLRAVVEYAAELQRSERFGHIRVLWGTAQLFKDAVYMNGAATSPQPEVFALAAAQVKQAMDATATLNGTAYVFWGGREGYATLLNTEPALEHSNLAAMLDMAAEYQQTFHGPFRDAQLLIEPKPQEPTTHQWDWDVAHTVGFLRKHGLEGNFKINVECNHATLAGHSCFHETEMARVEGMLGNVDANTGNPQVGWDTDEFLTDPREALLLGLSILRNGGLAPGGINFDAKLRRESTDLLDLVAAHVSGLDALAKGLRAAVALMEDGTLETMLGERYKGWSRPADGLGADIRNRRVDLAELEERAMAGEYDGAVAASGKQELFERLLTYYE